MLIAPSIGKLIHHIERKALTIEYTGLIIIFSAYAIFHNPHSITKLKVILQQVYLSWIIYFIQWQ